MTSTTSTTSASAWDEPAGIAPRGLVLLLPGRGEQPALYRRFGARIAADGYRVRVLSDPAADPGAARAALEAALVDERAVAPRVVLGVDTGALAALRAAARGSAPIDALILVGLPDPDRPGGEPVESWEDEVEYRASCPTHRGLIADAALVERGALRSDRIPQELREPLDLTALQLPVLGLHGDDDVLSPFDGVRAQYALLPEAEVVLVGHGRHDALNAASHRSVAARVVQFLESLRAQDDAPPILQEVKP
jgi:alpha-beta hydrolase superfamily lysophospholipase